MWDMVKKSVENVYGANSFQFTGENNAYIVKNGVALALLGISDKYVTLSLRASLSPNDAGLIASAIIIANRLMIVPNFEFKQDGSVAYGEEALDLVRDIVNTNWERRDRVEKEAFESHFCEKQREQPN